MLVYRWLRMAMRADSGDIGVVASGMISRSCPARRLYVHRMFRGAAVIVMHTTPEQGVQQHDASGREAD